MTDSAASFRVRNWAKFQHYRDRNPPWIKLHWSLISSRDWVTLDDASRVLAIACMLIASRNEDDPGCVPADAEYVRRVAYLNSKPDFKPLIACGFLESASAVLADASGCLQDARPETDTEAEKELLSEPDLFTAEFWPAYPRKEAKPKAASAFRRLSKTDQRAAVDGVAKWRDSGRWSDPKFIPLPASFLNARRWEDEICNVRELAPKRGFVC